MPYNILEDETDEKLLLLTNYMRDENKEMFTELDRKEFLIF